MNIALLIFFIILLIILIIIIPFKIRILVHVNYLNLEAYYLVNFLFINFLCGKMDLSNNGVMFKNKSNVLFKSKKKDEDKPNLAIYEYIKRMEVVNINFYKSYGNEDNAMQTAIITTIDKIIYDCLSYILSNKNYVMNSYGYIEPVFSESKNKTSIYAVVKISILDVIISLINAKLRMSKIVKDKEKNNV